MPSDINSAAHQYIEDHKDDEVFEVTLRFRNVADPELLLIDMELLLESLGEDGRIAQSTFDED